MVYGKGSLLFIYVFLAVVAALRWLPTDFNVAYFGNDTIYPLNPTMNATWLFSMWDPAQFGQPSFYPALIPYFSLFSAFHSLGLGLGASQHLYEWLVAFLAACMVGNLSAEIAAPQKNRPFIVALGGLIFLFVPSAIYQPLGWWVTLAIPLAIYGLKRAAESSNVIIAALWGLCGAFANLLMLNDVPNFQLQVVLCLWIAVFVGVALLSGTVQRKKVMSNVLIYALVSVALLTPLIGAEIWAVAQSFTAAMSSTPSRVGANGTYADLGYTTVGSVATLMSYYPPQWQNSLTSVVALILPSTALLAVFWQRRNPWVLGVGAATLLSIAITVGPNPPVGALYDWFMTHVPGAVAFRTVGKIHLFIAVGYAILAPIAVLSAYDFVARKSRRAYPALLVGIVSGAVLVAGVGFVGQPVWTGLAYRKPLVPMTAPRILPPIYEKAGDYLLAHSGRTLIYPDAGYTEESFPNGEYFGPSLTTYAFPRTVVYSRGGGYGSPATSPNLPKLYAALDGAIQAKPFDLMNSARRVSIGEVLSADVIRSGSIYSIIPQATRPTAYNITFHLHENKFIEMSNRILLLRLESVGVAQIRAWLDGEYLGVLSTTGGARSVAVRVSRSHPRTQDVVLSLRFVAQSCGSRCLVPESVSVGGMSLMDPLPQALVQEMLQDGIQYIFFDGAANGNNVPLFAFAINDDPRLRTILSDPEGRQLLEINAAAFSAAALMGNRVLRLGDPVYAGGRVSISFVAPGAKRLRLVQAYSHLWRYWASSDGGYYYPVASHPDASGARTILVLPHGSRFTIVGLYLPQILLIVQYVVFAAIACLMIVLLIARAQRTLTDELPIANPARKRWQANRNPL